MRPFAFVRRQGLTEQTGLTGCAGGVCCAPTTKPRIARGLSDANSLGRAFRTTRYRLQFYTARVVRQHPCRKNRICTYMQMSRRVMSSLSECRIADPLKHVARDRFMLLRGDR